MECNYNSTINLNHLYEGDNTIYFYLKMYLKMLFKS